MTDTKEIDCLPFRFFHYPQIKHLAKYIKFPRLQESLYGGDKRPRGIKQLIDNYKKNVIPYSTTDRNWRWDMTASQQMKSITTVVVPAWTRHKSKMKADDNKHKNTKHRQLSLEQKKEIYRDNRTVQNEWTEDANWGRNNSKKNYIQRK